jgi:hypothetical protein
MNPPSVLISGAGIAGPTLFFLGPKADIARMSRSLGFWPKEKRYRWVVAKQSCARTKEGRP